MELQAAKIANASGLTSFIAEECHIARMAAIGRMLLCWSMDVRTRSDVYEELAARPSMHLRIARVDRSSYISIDIERHVNRYFTDHRYNHLMYGIAFYVAVIAAGAVVLSKWFYIIDHIPRSGCLAVLGVLAALIGLGIMAALAFVHRVEAESEKGRIPSRLQATGAIYRYEQNLGIGPGANETGVVVYGLRPDDAWRLAAIDTRLNSSAAIAAALGSTELGYADWKRTPVIVDGDKFRRSPIKLHDFLNRYGFDIPIDPAVTRSIEATLSRPGAYYVFGRGGSLFVVAPHQQRVIFIYAG